MDEDTTKEGTKCKEREARRWKKDGARSQRERERGKIRPPFFSRDSNAIGDPPSAVRCWCERKKLGLSLFVFPWPVCFAHYPSLQVVDIPLRSTFTERKQLRHGLSVYASSRLPLCKLLNASRATVFFALEQPTLFSLPGCLPL